MPYRKLVGRAALIAGVGALALPVGAHAYDICVRPATGCDVTHTHDTVEQAINDADDAPAERDTIKLGAATYAPTTALNNRFDFNSLVDIVGAGAGSTVIEAKKNPDGSPMLNNSWLVYLQTNASSIRDLTIKVGDLTEYGLVLNGSTAERIRVEASATRPAARNDKGIVFNVGSTNAVRNSTVHMPYGTTNNDWGMLVLASGVIEDTTITGDNAIVAQNNGLNLDVRRSTLTGHRTFVLNGSGSATIRDSVVRSTPGSTDVHIGLQNESYGANNTLLTVKSTTVVGPSASGVAGETGEGVKVGHWADCGGGRATTNLDGVTVTGFSTNSLQDGRNPNTDGCGNNTSNVLVCGAAPPNAAQLQLTNYHRDGGQVRNEFGGCLGQTNVRDGAPNFVSDTDLRPRFPSPLIDQGNEAPDDGSKDFAGRARIVDGDGTGAARRDIGAFEYQRQAPVLTAGVDPASGPLSQLFRFSAVGTDADGETLTYIWDFTDGSTPLGATADKTFKTLGPHSGTVQAQDTAGVTAKATASVTVTGTPTPTPTPTATPTPGDTTAPAVTVKGGSLRVNARRKAKVTITCPATETAPCQIAIAVSSAKKILLGGKRKKIASLGKGSGRVANGKTATVTITLSKKAYRYLKRKRRLAARLAVTARDAAGNRATASARATLRPARARKKR